MSLTLTPVGVSEIEPMSISRGMMPIGRNYRPFASYPVSLLRRLSRRHARIFFERGEYFISDLGSKNGTLVNGKRIGTEALALASGDELNFGDDLNYVVTVDFEDTNSETQTLLAGPEFMLDPMKPGTGLLRIVIQQLPVLIGKEHEPFSMYEKIFPEEWAFFSRRHAHFYTQDGSLFLEDLGSTNGTYVDSQHLDAEPRLLKGGEVISFGGEFFEYRLTLIQPKQEEEADADGTQVMSGKDSIPMAPAVQEHAQEEAPRTVFVSSATSFLDIICSDDDEQGEPRYGTDGDALLDGQSGRGGVSAAGHPEAGWRGRSGLAKWIGGTVLTCAVAAVAFYLMSSGKEAEIRALISAGKLEQAARIADKWLAKPSVGENAEPLASEALMKHVLPDWLSHIEAQNFDAATSNLAAAYDLAANNEQGRQMLRLLAWVGDLEAFVASHGGAEVRITIYHDEPLIRDIISRWESDEAANRRTLSNITSHFPEFAGLGRAAYSNLRSIHAFEALNVAAIDDLSHSLREGLQQSTQKPAGERDRTLDALTDEISNFRLKYPKVSGSEKLDMDLADYRKLLDLVDRRDLAAVVSQLENRPPRTPPFIEHYRWLSESFLPPPAFLAGYRDALVAWEKGRADDAIASLHRLDRGKWHDLVESRLKHFERVSQHYNNLKVSSSAPDYTERLIDYYRLLDGESDIYYRNAFSEEFAAASNDVIAEADRLFVAARSEWRSFQDAGGIDGGIRIQPKITETFRKQAGRLSGALRHADDAAGLYDKVSVVLKEADRNLHSEIRLEVKRQRLWLKDLELVMGPTLTRSKMDLLPVVTERGEAK